MNSHSQNIFVATIDVGLSDKLLMDLKNRDFEITKPPYTRFTAKKKGLTCTLYESGKIVVQGKNCSEFVEFYLEPKVLQTFAFTHPLAQMDLTPRIGIDESGKGDFFGPLCIAGVYVQETQFAKLHAIGVKDSKSLSDRFIQKVAKEIQEICLYHIIRINPMKYNEIYSEFKNLNRLLAWGHAAAIEQLVQKSGCQFVIIDQFADEWVVEQALKRKKLSVQLTQRHRAEEDLAVAAASILARNAFLEGLDRLSHEVNIKLPKGSSKATTLVGQEILKQWGKEKLMKLCKQHFKNLDSILSKQTE